MRSWLLVVLVACDPGPSSPASWPGATSSSSPIEQTSPACSKAAPKGVIPKKVTVMGKGRSYSLVVPPSYVPSISQPLIFVLHGHGGSGAQARSSFDIE